MGKLLYLEIPILIIFYAFLLTSPIYTNLVIFRTCYVILGYNESECELLGSNEPDAKTHTLEELVQPHASIITMTRTVSEAVISSMLCLFIGPWSDKFGRKPVLITSLVGIIISNFMMVYFSSIKYLSPWYFLFCSIPITCTGGISAFLTAAFSYITDVTSEANRGLRLGVFEIFFSMGIFLGNVTSSYILYATSYPIVFAIAGLCLCLAVLYIIYLVPETIVNTPQEGRFKGFFQVSHLREMFIATFRRRDHYDRPIILLCIAIVTLYIFAINADVSVFFLYLREHFGWTLQQFTLFSSGHNICWILGTMFGVYVLHKLLDITETVVLLVGLLSLLNSVLVQGLATTNWHIYAVGVIRCLGGVTGPMCRSLISKITPPCDVGKVFSLVIASQSLFGIMGAPLYTEIYNATLETFPQLFSFISAGVYCFNISLAIAVIVLQYKTPRRIEYDNLNSPVNEDASEVVEQPT